MKEADLLVIGAGIAGGTAALRAADMGMDVIVLSHLQESEINTNTSWAQGGIVYRGREDSTELLIGDIQRAGVGICRDDALKFMAEHGPEIVRKFLIERCGIEFDRQADGSLHFTAEGAHSCPRVLHVQDATGRAIAKRILDEIRKHPRIELYEDTTAIDLVMRGYHTRTTKDIYLPQRCMGAYALLATQKRVETFVARETILATGGLGQIYLHTTNPPKTRGDGLAMAYRVGARVINLEYIQFHPTALYMLNRPRYLITEALRGEGAKLVDPQGRQFMGRYHELGELAARDVVARAIHEEMLIHGEPCMYLDISERDATWIKERFPNIYSLCLRFGIDITQQPIPVVPAAHYSCGGILVDLSGHSNIDGLRAVGEVSCTGIHGANRLASTSLLEAVTWGYNAAEDVYSERKLHPLVALDSIQPWETEKEETDPALIQQDWLTIQYTMWNYVGLVRTTHRLNRAIQILRELQYEVEYFYRRAFPSDAVIGLRNGVQTALAVTYSAYRNRKSLGTHFRPS